MFRLEISTDNAAFEEDRSEEVVRILEALATRLRNTADAAGVNGALGASGTLRDVNGNPVGIWTFAQADGS